MDIFDLGRFNTPAMLTRTPIRRGGLLVFLLTSCAPLLEASPGSANLGSSEPPKTIRLSSANGIPLSTRTFPQSNSAGWTHSDLMQRVRFGFRLGDERHPDINVQLAWFQRNPAYLDRVFGRASLYMHHIVGEVERRGIPLEIALLPVIESAFEPFAYSSASASGLWQFIPDTGSRFGLPQTWWYDGRRDVVEATRAALDYLQFLHTEFKGDWLLAVAGYNCGERCVARAIERNRREGKPTNFWNLKLPDETRAYVPKLLAMRRLVANPSRYGLEFSPIRNEPYFTRVEVGHQIDLRFAADLAGLTHDELFELNPAFHRWATPPGGPHRLLLPIDTAELFKRNLSQLTPDELMRITHHSVRSGEALRDIAERYGSDETTLRMLNGLTSNRLRTGMNLRVPAASAPLPEKVLRAAARVDGSVFIERRSKPEGHVVVRREPLSITNHFDNLMPYRTTPPPLVSSIKRQSSIPEPSGFNSNGLNSKRERLTHRVKSGETLETIAQRYGVTISQLSAWNGLTTNSALKSGQRLTIRAQRS